MVDSLVIEHATILTLNDADDVHFDGNLIIEGDRITAVGPASSTPPPAGAEKVDGRGKLVMPGLIDLHYHTAIGKGWSDHLPLWEYLDTCWYPIIRALDPEAAYWAALLSYAESLKAGVTTANDMYRQLPALARAATEIGIRVVLSNDVADSEHELDTLDDNRAAYEQCHGMADGRVEVYVGIEWLPMASFELLTNARALANELSTGIHIHLNESLSEVESSKKRFGRRPTEVAYDAGILGPDCVAAHCVWLSDLEIGLMRETGTHVSHNPSSNAKLGNGVARVPELLGAGINVGLGHDAAECNNSLDMFEVMKFASLVHRATRLDAALQQAPDVIRMATRNGATALGHQTGQLRPGWKADLIVIDLDNEMFTPLAPENKAQLYSHLVFAANGSAVATTIVDGRIVVRDHHLVSVDEGQVRAEANRAFQRVLARMKTP